VNPKPVSPDTFVPVHCPQCDHEIDDVRFQTDLLLVDDRQIDWGEVKEALDHYDFVRKHGAFPVAETDKLADALRAIVGQFSKGGDHDG